MKRKVINYTIVISIIIVCISLGYITYNLTLNKKTPNNVDTNTEIGENDNNENEQVNNSNEEKLTDVVLNSKIGNELTSMLYISNIYSSGAYAELEENGLSDKYKRMYTFVRVSLDSEYNNMLRESENYAGYYITAKDLENTMKTFFANTSNINHGTLFSDVSYDSENKNYIIVPMGFAGTDLNVVVDVPYKIEESDNNYYLYAYRVYLTKLANLEDLSESVEYVVYYDSQRQNEGLRIDDINVDNPNTQVEVISNKISDSSINKNKLKKVKYTFEKQGNKKLISGYEEVN